MKALKTVHDLFLVPGDYAKGEWHFPDYAVRTRIHGSYYIIFAARIEDGASPSHDFLYIMAFRSEFPEGVTLWEINVFSQSLYPNQYPSKDGWCLNTGVYYKLVKPWLDTHTHAFQSVLVGIGKSIGSESTLEYPEVLGVFPDSHKWDTKRGGNLMPVLYKWGVGEPISPWQGGLDPKKVIVPSSFSVSYEGRPRITFLKLETSITDLEEIVVTGPFGLRMKGLPYVVLSLTRTWLSSKGLC